MYMSICSKLIKIKKINPYFENLLPNESSDTCYHGLQTIQLFFCLKLSKQFVLSRLIGNYICFHVILNNDNQILNTDDIG